MPASKKTFSRLMLLIFSAFLCISLCAPFTGSCEEPSAHSIKLICRRDNTILTGMKWRLYRIGERSGDKIVLTGDFAEYPVDMDGITEENVEQKAKTLESYAVADSIAPVGSGETDENGELKFNGLSSGVYLAVGRILNIGHTYYVPSSLLLEANDTDISFSYDAYPKFTYATLGGSVGSYTVRKVWVNDSPGSVAHPTYVTVDLFRNEELYDTVVLNEENNWEYRWRDLEPINDWHVAERDIPVDYTVLIDFNSTQFLIKNSFRSTDISTTTTTATATGTTTSTEIGQTTRISTTATAITQSSATKPPTTTIKLPPLIQTGQLWWPVIPLSAGGLVLISLGTLIKNKKDEK